MSMNLFRFSRKKKNKSVFILATQYTCVLTFQWNGKGMESVC